MLILTMVFEKAIFISFDPNISHLIPYQVKYFSIWILYWIKFFLIDLNKFIQL